MSGQITGWAALAGELDRWAATGGKATLWWRDDDAVEETDALKRLLGIAAASGVPLTLAVIPAALDDSLPRALEGAPHVTPIQHGLAHVNHAPANEKKSEFGPGRTLREITRDIADGQRRMGAAFGSGAPRVLAPPWNRIDSRAVAALPDLGYTGLSTFGPRDEFETVPGLTWINTHLDIVDWRGGRGFVGERRALETTINFLSTQRQAGGNAGTPFGLLTHHLAQDDDGWSYIETFVATIVAHPAATWLAADEIFTSRA